MAATNGRRSSAVMVLAGAVIALSATVAPGQQQPDEVARLAAMLAQPGAEGREARERAIERLLASDRTEAHAVLHERLQVAADVDGVRPAIVASLQRHVLLAPEQQFGGATGKQRERLLGQWLRALAPMWRDLRRNAEDPGTDPVRQAARSALQRVHRRCS
jgi:hypothetical protein